MTALYHITHIDNLPGIINAGRLWCDALRASKVASGARVVGIAHQHIKARRAKRIVQKAAGGTLTDYVPFYFAPRSPMLFTIKQGNVVGYSGGQEQVVHLVTTVTAACSLTSPWCFTDGHAEMEISAQFDQLTDLCNIDWNILTTTMWNDTPEDGDRKRRRQAEFLVHRDFPWAEIAEIGVMSQDIAVLARAALNGAQHRPQVVVRPQWYY